MDAADQSPPRISLLAAAIPVASLIGLIAATFIVFGIDAAKGPTQVAMTLAIAVTVVTARLGGFGFAALTKAATDSVASGLGAIFILLAIGALIGAWAMCGTLAAMVYYGLAFMPAEAFYLATALVCAAVSSSIGSSWTVAGTIGVGLMGVAANMGLDPAITAGAVISGAYFGDTTSPLSESVGLATGAAEAPYYTHIRETALSSGLAFAIALVVFWMLGAPGAADVEAKMAALDAAFDVSPLLFLPMVVVVALAALRFPPFTTLLAGALAGCALALVVAPERVATLGGAGEEASRAMALFMGVIVALQSGYVSGSGNAAVDLLATRGGMEGMLHTVWLIMVAFAFGGLVEKTGVLDRLIAPVLAVARSGAALVAACVGSVLATNAVAGDQYLAIVLPGRMFRRAFADRGLDPVVLSRTIGLTATPTSALVPWNSCGAYMAATLGVATLSYAPYAAFSLASPLVTVALAAAGLRMLRAPPQPGVGAGGG